MSREFRMPSLGADMEAGMLVEWRVRPGSTVHKGEVVALVETDKGIIDLESFTDGAIERLLVEPGTRVPVGTALALFAGEELPGVAPSPEAPRTATPAPAALPEAPAAAVPGGRQWRISPAARARARALGVDPAAVQPTEPGGIVTLQDVERAAAVPGSAPAAPRAEGGSRDGLRAAIAAAMSRSKREIPHYYVQLAMDCSAMVEWLASFNAARPPAERMLATVLLAKTVAHAASERPGFSGFFEAQGFVPGPMVNVGVAIALRGGGVVAPALLEADRKPLVQLMAELRGLVERARSGHLRSGELAGGTITITSLGDEGVDSVTPVIQPPQVAIVGFGSILERPWAEAGQVAARPVLTATLAADHRVTDGRQGAQFLACVRDWLRRPGEL